MLAMQALGGDPQCGFLLGVAALGYALALDWSRKRAERNGGHPPADDGLVRPRRLAVMLAAAAGCLAAWFAVTVLLGIVCPRIRPPYQRPPVPPLPWMPYLGAAVALAWAAAAGLLLYRWRGRPWRNPLGRIWLGLAISAALAMAAAAAQLFPVIEFTQQTTRASSFGTHELYAFSIEPYRLIELICPNLWGAQFDGNTYWAPMIQLPGAYPRIWVPSLYVGGFTFLLAITALGFRSGPPWRVWLSVIMVVSILGALGEYTSPIWLTRVFAAVSRSAAIQSVAANLGPADKFDTGVIRLDGHLRDGDGGIYWLLANLLPGFRQFRFPAKLFTFTVVAILALSGMGWDRLGARRARDSGGPDRNPPQSNGLRIGGRLARA